MLQTVSGVLETLVDRIWDKELAILLTAAGLLFTIRTLGVQWRILTHGIGVIRGKYDNPDDPGNLSHFQALCAALSATIGLGNIAGVAVAVAAGGPGAVFWMWVVGFLGMATKFTTCSLAVMYREVDRTGTQRGGPMWYIEKGLGPRWKPMAVAFAVLGAIASFGGGNMFQANQAADIFNQHFGIAQWLTGGVLAMLTGLVIVGGIRRIGRVAATLVPMMCVIYVLGATVIILTNYDRIPGLLADILRSAFAGTAMAGAFAGVAVKEVVIQGARRACFSNEAGLGSAPMAHATAKTNEPIREGIVAGIGPFVDTIVICTMTALVILISGSLYRGPIGTVAAVSEPHVVSGKSGEMLRVTFSIQKIAGLTANNEAASGKAPYLSTRFGGKERLFVRGLKANGAPVDLEIEAPPMDFDDPNPIIGSRTFSDIERAKAELEEKYAPALAAGNQVFLHRKGVTLTAYAFDQGIPRFGTYFVPLAVFLFALSTLISWSFYGETCTEYLFGERAVLPFKLVYVGLILVGAVWKIDPVLNFSDIMFGLMVVPNLIAAILLSGTVANQTRDYFSRHG